MDQLYVVYDGGGDYVAFVTDSEDVAAAAEADRYYVHSVDIVREVPPEHPTIYGKRCRFSPGADPAKELQFTAAEEWERKPRRWDPWPADGHQPARVETYTGLNDDIIVHVSGTDKQAVHDAYEYEVMKLREFYDSPF